MSAGPRIVTLSREECLSLLAENSFGRVSVGLGDGPPLIRPVNYVFDRPSQSVAFRTSPGSKLHAILHAAGAAFEIDGIDAGSRTGWSVVIVGVSEEVTRPDEVARLERIGLEVWAPGERDHWVRIRARTVSGLRIAS